MVIVNNIVIFSSMEGGFPNQGSFSFSTGGPGSFQQGFPGSGFSSFQQGFPGGFKTSQSRTSNPQDNLKDPFKQFFQQQQQQRKQG